VEITASKGNPVGIAGDVGTLAGSHVVQVGHALFGLQAILAARIVLVQFLRFLITEMWK
jgi:hypothetical protein